MVIVAARRAFVGGEVYATVGGTIGGGLHHVNRVGILGINVDATDVKISGDARIFRDLAPGCAAVVTAEEAGIHDGENALAFGAGSNGKADAVARSCGQA